MNVINKGEKRKIITAYNSNQIMKSEPQTQQIEPPSANNISKQGSKKKAELLQIMKDNSDYNDHELQQPDEQLQRKSQSEDLDHKKEEMLKALESEFRAKQEQILKQ